MRRILSFLASTLLLFLLALPAVSKQASAAPANLISNPSVETLQSANKPTNWTADMWGTSKTTMSVTSSAHSGSKALSIVTTSRSSGDAKWVPAAVAVTSGQTYTYTDYSKATVATQLDAEYLSASGTATYDYLATAQPSTGWQLNTVNITVPANVQKVSILHILSTKGTLITDDFSLTGQTTVTPPPPTGGNLIADPSMETANGSAPAGWQTDNWGTNSASFAYVTNDGHSGSSSAKVSISSYTDGDAKWYFTPVSVQPNTQYTFSDWYKSTITTSLVVRFDDGNGNYTYIDTADPAPASNWTQATSTFTAPSNTKYVTMLHLIAGVGTLQTDDASLAPTQPVNSNSNLIPNSSLETVNPTSSQLPQSWQQGGWGTNSAEYSYLTTGHTGNRSVGTQITSYTNGAAYWYAGQQPVTGGQLYDYQDYYESNAASEIDATFTMSDGSQQYMYLGTAAESPNSWTKFNVQFTAPAGAVSVLLDHSIYSVGYVTTDDYSLTQFAYQGFNRAIVSITDDDGFTNFYTNGLPVLQKYNLPVTAYIISGYIGATDYMTASQIKTLQADGIEIGSHSVDHPGLSTLSASQQDAELKNSQTTLQNLLGVPVTDYAAPYGVYNQQIASDAQNYYQTYRSTEAGYNALNNFDPMNLQVQNITSSTTVADIQGWLNEAAATNTWLILVYHEVDTNPVDTTYNTLPTDFDAQMAAIKNSGIATETVNQAMQEITPQL